MNYYHENLSGGRWNDFSFPEQMANIGSEINRALSWKNKNNLDYSRKAFERGLELLDFTIKDIKNKDRLRELSRLREVLADYFYFDNIYNSKSESFQNYFYAFTYNAQMNK